MSASLSQMGFQTLLIALPVLAFTRYGQNPKVAGLLALAVASPALETLGVTPVLAGVAAVATTAAVTFAAVAMDSEGRAGSGPR